MLVWLGICAVFCFIGAIAGAFFAVPPAPTFHLIFAAGAMPLIFGAVIHFVPVLTRSGQPAAIIRGLPLLVQCAGFIVPLALAGLLPRGLLHAASLLVSIAALVLIIWIGRCLRTALGMPHPGARWYGAAMLCLFFAVSMVPAWLAQPGLGAALRLFHLHLNTLGFIGLTALGTLPVLLPTAIGRTEPQAGSRLRTDLLPAVSGALLLAAGSAGALWLALPGSLLLAWVASRNLAAWWRSYGLRGMLGDGATASLAAAQAGFLLLLLAGMAHALGVLAARPALASFAALFLWPLVTGALSQLLPVWRYPGPDSAVRRQMRRRLAAGGGWRALLFLVGGVLELLEGASGMALAAVGLLWFALALLRAFWLDRQGSSDDNPQPTQTSPSQRLP